MREPCEHCRGMCWARMPANAPVAARLAYPSSQRWVRTCARGQAYERSAFGWNITLIRRAITNGNGDEPPIDDERCEQCGELAPMGECELCAAPSMAEVA